MGFPWRPVSWIGLEAKESHYVDVNFQPTSKNIPSRYSRQDAAGTCRMAWFHFALECYSIAVRLSCSPQAYDFGRTRQQSLISVL